MNNRFAGWFGGAADPVKLAEQLKFKPDPWQKKVLRSNASYVHIVSSRQVGKSTTTALAALHCALYRPGSVVLIFSPTDRQSGELFLKISGFYKALGKPIDAPQETVHMLRLENDSRIISLPASESGVRGFTATMILLDEAAFVLDTLIDSVSPMLAVSGGRLIMMGTPNGQRGRFWEASTSKLWEHYVVPATDCPRISKEFLEAERERLGDAVFEQEYCCSFTASAGSAFRAEDIAAAFEGRNRPAPAEPTTRRRRTPEDIFNRRADQLIRRQAKYGPQPEASELCRHGIPLGGRCIRCAQGR